MFRLFSIFFSSLLFATDLPTGAKPKNYLSRFFGSIFCCTCDCDCNCKSSSTVQKYSPPVEIKESLQTSQTSTVLRSATASLQSNKSTLSIRKIACDVLRVLIVDDEAISRKFLGKICAENGINKDNVQYALSGEEVMEKFSKCISDFDIIFMDKNMCEGFINGIETTRRIRLLAGGERPIIISASADESDEARREYTQCGMNGLFPKPFIKGNFLKLLREHFVLTQ